MNIELNEFGFKRINNINQMKIKHMNECSIVFRIGEEVIAFGDVSERIIKYLSRNTKFIIKPQIKVELQTLLFFYLTIHIPKNINNFTIIFRKNL